MTTKQVSMVSWNSSRKGRQRPTDRTMKVFSPPKTKFNSNFLLLMIVLFPSSNRRHLAGKTPTSHHCHGGVVTDLVMNRPRIAATYRQFYSKYSILIWIVSMSSASRGRLHSLFALILSIV